MENSLNETDSALEETKTSHRDIDEEDSKAQIDDSGNQGSTKRMDGSLRRMSRNLSKTLTRQSSSIAEALPETTTGWTVFTSVILSAILGYEVQLQHRLTHPPVTFCQNATGSVIEQVYKKLTESPDHILSRSIAPSLFVGTRGTISSTAAYFMGGPSSASQKYMRFREIITMSQDGANIAVDWEIPLQPKQETSNSKEQQVDQSKCKSEILEGPIQKPVVIILHGINNDASFGYMKSLQRTFCDRGWNAASMNFRGTAIRLTTPRGYNGAYTGDLRSLVYHIAGRMAPNVPIFLVGNSLGANIMTKYLGEEGLAGTLPSCVAGGASLGNPLLLDSSNVKFPFSVLMALGVKKIYLDNWKSIRALKDDYSRQSFHKGLMASTIEAVDNAVAPIFIRNDEFYPYGVKIGYRNGEHYWFDASSYRHVRHISVPFLNLTAQDDFLVSRPSRNKLGYCIGNPNVMVVETRCGGHLGWQESPPDTAFGSSSWADVATADFFDAVMKTNTELSGTAIGHNETETVTLYESSVVGPGNMEKDLKQIQKDSIAFQRTIKPRL
ncbi:alpha/beta fold family hydrolase [Nitzschia inconspicua]|uniref:Alpha/beta fold family hydrolase n=1 Tax=Nitzschia inconspicua TaxID=303405 RepID=A0A9K3PTF1_9STRA|nr:alpha/beta fold family hydrolase [Nitzschia inconspicua]